jgi:hypothetical protein
MVSERLLIEDDGTEWKAYDFPFSDEVIAYGLSLLKSEGTAYKTWDAAAVLIQGGFPPWVVNDFVKKLSEGKLGAR